MLHVQIYAYFTCGRRMELSGIEHGYGYCGYCLSIQNVVCHVHFKFAMSRIMLGIGLCQCITCTCIWLVEANDSKNGGLCSHDNSSDAVLLK